MRSVSHPAALRPVAAAAATLLLLAGCASLPAPVAPSATPGASRGPGEASTAAAAAGAASGSAANAAATGPGVAGKPPAAATPPGSPPAFATVIKDAKRVEGLLPLWQKDDKVWIELRPQDLNTQMFLSPKIAQGIGEAGLFGGTVIGRWQPWGRPQIVEFRRVHNQIRLIARNDQFVAASGTPEARAVEAAFSDSLIGSTAVASLPHPTSKAVLIEANALFVTDLLGLGINLQRAFRQSYSFDARNSAITSVRGMPDELVFDVSSHFASSNLSLPQPTPPTTPGAPVPSLPTSLPDARSLFIGVHYSLAKLPERPMAPRKADPRIGHFTSLVQNFGGDLDRTPKQRYVNRWRLEKKDPAAALSEPVKPITFWLDRTIPLKYRDAIARGVLEWNKAFERIGFKDALVAKIQPDDASFDTLDLNVASIRWMTNARPIFGAIGPSHVDPRTGEILDADIGIESLSSRNVRAARAQILTSRAGIDWPALMQSGGEPGAVGTLAGGHGANAFFTGSHDHSRCEQGEFAAEQLGYALDVLEARGEIAPDGPEADAFVQAYLTDTTMHEVGHTLGLRHNFRSSRIYTDAQLSDPTFTHDNGLAGSVMEYAAINLALPGGQTVSPFQTTLGPYDYWAIEYAYKPLPPQATAAEQEAELQRIAGRSAERELAYGTDEDNGIGIDPEALMFDLGDDPVAFAKKRIVIAQDLLARQENRPLKPTEDYSVLRRALAYALRDAARASGVLLRQIGGLRTLRDFPGSGRDPLQPVSVAAQREALNTLTSQVLAPGSFRISPALGRKLGPDYQERIDSAEGGVSTDFTLESMVVDMQSAVLNRLMSDGLSARLLDAYEKADTPQDTLPLNELYDRVAREIWSELGKNSDITSTRRELQREHVNRLIATLLRPTSSGRADARSLLRMQAKALLARLEAPQSRSALSAEARAHLADSAELLRTALAAPLQRAGV